jgi:hypothetical protein
MAAPANTATSAEPPRARNIKSTRPPRKRVVETVSGAEQLQLEPPPYKR